MALIRNQTLILNRIENRAKRRIPIKKYTNKRHF